MKKAIIYLVLLLSATAGVAFGQGRRPGGFSTGGATTNERPSNNTPKATKMADPYSILLTQSIFARDRRSSTERTIEPIIDPPNPETFLAFRGVTVIDDKAVIFLEDTRDNTLFHLHIGDTVSNTGGKLTGVSLDGTSQYILAYTHKDGLTTSPIPLGNSLANVEVAPPAVADATSAFGSPFGGGFGGPGGFGGRQQFGGNQFNGGNISDLQAAMGRGGRQQRGQGGQGGFGGPGGGQYGQIDTSGFGTGGGGRQRFGQQGGGQFDPTQQGQGGQGGRRGGGRRGGGGGGAGGGFGG